MVLVRLIHSVCTYFEIKIFLKKHIFIGRALNFSGRQNLIFCFFLNDFENASTASANELLKLYAALNVHKTVNEFATRLLFFY